jgi:DNA-binding transcriptional regulator LsrR (DeoR family)
LVIGVAKGQQKLAAIQAALKGRLINGLMTDEITAQSLLGS